MTATYSQLDSDLRDYLAAVARNKGAGAPGVYIPGGSYPWPAFGCLLGALMILLVIGAMFTLPKSAWAAAMLITAGFWLGGWLVLYPFRRWLGNRLGTFKYFDTHTVYDVNADEVTATDISDMNGLSVEHKYSGTSFIGSKLNFQLPGRSYTIGTQYKALAEKVERYYAALEQIEADPAWQNRTPAEHGAMGAYHSQHGEWPADLKLTGLTLEVPEALPTKSPSRRMAGRYLALLAVGAAIYAMSWQLLQPLQDDEAFKAAASVGVQGYRDYILDDRNTRHIDEARAKIRELYEPKLKQVDQQSKTPEFNAGLKSILKSLSESASLPVVSIRVTEEPGAAPNFEAMKDSREKLVRQELADALGTHFESAFITFVEAPAGEPAHFDLMFKQVDAEKYRWQITLRETPDGTAVVGPERFASVVDAVNPAIAIKQSVFMALFGIAPPTVLQQPIGGGDFNTDE